ncbi:MAG TPA: adenylate kinase [Bryobacteraceae bacterium]|nr:adenylate kinase [Bryobacteraceae bacterium]
MIFLLFGPPGCGKGTQAVHLANRFQIPAISTGEMFRAECKAGTELGRTACAIMTKGGLVPDELTNAIVAGRIAQPDCANGFLLDGYPRTVPQAEAFDQLLRERGLPAPIVIHLDVSEDLLVARLTARRQCPVCRRIYNMISQPPRVAGRCDDDGAELITRDDDKEETIRQRLNAYHELTGPILDYYGESMVRRVDGGGSPKTVAKEIEQVANEALSDTLAPY